MTSGPRSLRCAHASSSSDTATSRCRSVALPALASSGLQSFRRSRPFVCFPRAQLYGAIQSLSFNDLTGSALVEYSTIGEAVSANNALQGQAIAGQELKVAFETVGGPPQPPGRTGASASAPGAPAVVGRPSFTAALPASPLGSHAASHLRCDSPYHSDGACRTTSWLGSLQLSCTAPSNKWGRFALQCLCWFPPCTPPTRTPFETTAYMPRQHRLLSTQQLMQGANPSVLLHQQISLLPSNSRGCSAAV